MQLLQDVFIVENLQIINEGKTKDTMRIRGIFGRCNEKNNNGRIYPTAVLEGQLKKMQPLIQERRLCGELDHPSNDTVKLSNASHLITKLEIKGNELIGEAEILKTPAGLTAKALIDGGVRVGISSRGMGTLSEDAQGNKVVNEDYRLVTFDLVADPSTRGAFPSLAESTQSRFARESQSKLQKEGNFVTLLKSKFRQEFRNVLSESILFEGKIECPTCRGGRRVRGGATCPTCKGAGKVDDGKPDSTPPPADGPKPDDAKPADGPKPDDAKAGGADDDDDRDYRRYMRYQAMSQFAPQQSTGNIFKDYIARYHQRKSIEGLAKSRAAGEGLADRQRVKNQRDLANLQRSAQSGYGFHPLRRLASRAGSLIGIPDAPFSATPRREVAHTEYLRIGKIFSESRGLLEYKDPKTGERYTTPAAAERYERKHGGGQKQDMGKFGTTEFTKTGEGQVLKNKEGKITSIRPHGSKGKFPVPVKLKMKESFIRVGKSLLEKASERLYSDDPDERVKQRKERGDWKYEPPSRGHYTSKTTPEKIFRGTRTPDAKPGSRYQITHVTDKKTNKTEVLPTKAERDKARKERQERLAANVKKVAGK